MYFLYFHLFKTLRLNISNKKIIRKIPQNQNFKGTLQLDTYCKAKKYKKRNIEAKEKINSVLC